MSPDHPDSNYRAAAEALLDRIAIPPENVHRVRAEHADASRAAEAYELELQAFFALDEEERPRFDLVLLGLGADGHTASLFPHTDALHETERLVVANPVPALDTQRITLTWPTINQARCILFLVSGASKAETLRRVLEGEHRPELLPSQLIRPEQGELLWLADRDAAGSLSI